MNKKILALAIAGAMVSPSALAAVDTSGMQYTSASEGFYGSIRAKWESNNSGAKKGDSNLGSSTNRIGVRGTLDLGGGLEGFYQGEWAIDNLQGSNVTNRIGHVGLRAGFGELVFGSFWANDYGWTHGSTDVANSFSGNLNYSTNREGRPNNSLQYTTPDLSGFQAAVRLTADDDGTDDNGDALDAWNLAAKYDVQGFTVAGSYNVRTDGSEDNAVGTGTEDAKSWTARLGYAQDNWYVNGWYGSDDAGLDTKVGNADLFSIAGGVALDKVNLYAMYESTDPEPAAEDEANFGVLGVQYNLGARSRIWAEYELHDDSTTAEDSVNIGLRHDF